MYSIQLFKTIKKTLPVLFILFMLFEPMPVMATIPPGANLNDLALRNAVKRDLTRGFKRLEEGFRKAAPDFQRMGAAAGTIKVAIVEMSNQIKKNSKINSDWQDNTKPVNTYDKDVDKFYKALKKLDTDHNIALALLTPKSFDNDAANINMSAKYGEHSTIDKADLALSKSMCPDGTIKPSLGTTNTYPEIQRKSCQIVFNATAYKQTLNNNFLEKQKLFDDVVQDITDRKIGRPAAKDTIGEHDAKKTALDSIRLIRELAYNEYHARLAEADTYIQLAEKTRKHAANAIVTGPPPTGKPMAVAAAKTALSVALGAVITATAPYNP